MATKRRRRRGSNLGHTAKKHHEYAHNTLDVYEESVRKAVKLAHEGNCDKALEEAVYASYMRGGAEAHARAGKVGARTAGGLRSRFYEGGPGIAQRDLGYVLDRCSVRRR